MNKLEEKLKNDPEALKKFEAVIKEAKNGKLKSDSEALSAAAAAVGVEISPEEIEKDAAAAQTLSDSDLELATGGNRSKGEDAVGHDNWCLSAWHCYATLMHTDTGLDQETCWSNYLCVWANVYDEDLDSEKM